MTKILEHHLFKKLAAYHLIIFFSLTILFYEFFYSFLVYGGLVIHLGWLITFVIPVILVCQILTATLSTKVNRITALLITLAIGTVYNVYFIYFRIFKTTLSLYSLGGAGDAMQFASTVIAEIQRNLFPVLLFFIPTLLYIVLRKHWRTTHKGPATLLFLGLAAVIVFSSSTMLISSATPSNGSPTALYNQRAPLDQLSKNFGLLTTIRLDYVNMTKGMPQPQTNTITSDSGSKYLRANPNRVIQDSVSLLPPKQGAVERYIDFNLLYSEEQNSKLRNMHNYFRKIEPTTKNAYTGMFAGHNLILITAESFYPYAIDPVYTPTLYQMSTEGFVFENFYNPLWGVSTTDGEYVACTGLIPKAGVWSFKESSDNALPFVMGNQFRSLDYPTYAYHNHSYRYYARDLSHPNMGYVYKGLGNGLTVQKTWPESDGEMIDVTTPEFLAEEPFHAYFMTVSGHLEYNFMGNAMARKNENLVADAPYSDAGRAYIAANIEFDRSMKLVI